MNFSEDVTFIFPIERESGDDDQEIELTISGSAYFRSGKLSGPPEDCYPDEGDVEMEECKDANGVDWTNLLTDKERERILEKIEEEAREQACSVEDEEPISRDNDDD